MDSASCSSRCARRTPRTSPACSTTPSSAGSSGSPTSPGCGGAWERRRSADGWQGWLNWAIRDRADRRALGWAQATVEGRSASVAYALLPDERGRGAASDALRAMTAWLRLEHGAPDVTASIAPENTASERVARAAGFALTERWADGERVWIYGAEGAG